MSTFYQYDAATPGGNGADKLPITEDAKEAFAAAWGLARAGLGPDEYYEINVTEDTLIPNPVGSFSDGQSRKYRIRQDGTGGHDVTLDTDFRYSTRVPAPQFSIDPDLMDYLAVVWCQADAKWDIVGFLPGYPIP